MYFITNLLKMNLSDVSTFGGDQHMRWSPLR
jgi:hypothetical protein